MLYNEALHHGPPPASDHRQSRAATGPERQPGEALHHGPPSGNASHGSSYGAGSHFRQSVDFALARLLELSADRTGGELHVAVRESTAQHFWTPHAPARLAGSYDGLERGADGEPTNQTCTDQLDRAPHDDWHNEVLRSAHAHALAAASRAGAPAPHFLRFHSSTLLWRPTLFPPEGPDCTHTFCYTPFYWLPLWTAWAASLREGNASSIALGASPTAREHAELRSALQR